MVEISVPPLKRGKRTVLEAFSFSSEPGEMLALVGPNGAGKSTLLRAIAGLAPEKAMIARGGYALERKDIGHLPQAFSVTSSISVLECILLGRREELGLRVPGQLITEAFDILNQLGLADISNRPMSALSGGQQQRVLIAQRLFRAPKLMLMDEPTSALDVHHQLSSLSVLRAYAKASAGTMIVALHDLTLAARFCDRVVLVENGKCHAPQDPEMVLTRDVLQTHWRVNPEFLQSKFGQMVIVPHEFTRNAT